MHKHATPRYANVQVTGSGVGVLFQIGAAGWFTGRYNFQCQPVDHSKSPQTMRVIY